MALLSCPECNNEVSSLASTCPNCGYPIGGAGHSQSGDARYTTIQQTSKELKLHQVIALFVFLIGLLWTFFTFADGKPEGPLNPLMFILVIGGFIGTIVTGLRTWWHHG